MVKCLGTHSWMFGPAALPSNVHAVLLHVYTVNWPGVRDESYLHGNSA